jgi:hypothetical protein
MESVNTLSVSTCPFYYFVLTTSEGVNCERSASEVYCAWLLWLYSSRKGSVCLSEVNSSAERNLLAVTDMETFKGVVVGLRRYLAALFWDILIEMYTRK